MAVPDTNTFTLQDVKTEFELYESGTFDDLQLMVNNARSTGSPYIPPNYSATYLETYPNSLYGFRGYNHTPPVTLSISPTSIGVPNSGGHYTITVTSNTTWTASDSLIWLSESPTSGSNNGTFVITVLANKGSTRTGTVTVTGYGTQSKYVSITQYGDTV